MLSSRLVERVEEEDEGEEELELEPLLLLLVRRVTQLRQHLLEQLEKHQRPATRQGRARSTW
eukprot:5682282-Prymnesium_polylepis.1